MAKDLLQQKKVLVITGPTATGKSVLAVEIARKFDSEIISADSRQVYKGLDIGSAKITEQEMQGIPHYLIDVAHPAEIFSVAEFQKLAQEKIADIHKRGKLPILVGGTGMYISAVIDGITFPKVAPDKKLRADLEKKGTAELYQQLQKTDSVRALAIGPHNRVRLVRALEIAESFGSVPILENNTPDYDLLVIGLELPKSELVQRITDRIEQRIPALFDEIKKLHESGVSWERLDSLGLEYRYGAHYVQGEMALDEFKKVLTTKTWQFVKRQMTWFKRDSRIQWINPVSKKDEILRSVQDFLVKP